MPNKMRNDEILENLLKHDNLDPNEIQVHNSCGSARLEERRWVNINSNEVFGGDGTDDVYCNKCEKLIHVSDIISMTAYDEHKEGSEKIKK